MSDFASKMYTVASIIISTYAGMPFEEFVQSRIFHPLGMNSTTYSGATAADFDLLSQTWSVEGRRIPYWFSENTEKLMAGPGGIISCTEDLVRLGRSVRLMLTDHSHFADQMGYSVVAI